MLCTCVCVCVWQLLTAANVVKIADFGLAVRCGPSVPPLTSLVGTAAYLAPEMVRAAEEGGAPYGVSVDLFALGGVLYALLATYTPFEDPEAELSDDEIIERVRRGQWSFAARRTPWEGVSSAAKQLIAALLDADPAKRPTAIEVLHYPWACPTAQEVTKPRGGGMGGGSSYTPFAWDGGSGRELDLCWGAGCGMYM